MSIPTELKNLLSDLVAIPSVSPSIRPQSGPSGETAVCEYLRDWLTSQGISSEMPEVLPGRTNLYAKLDFGRPQTVILSAHTDTVPADDWHGDPFHPREQDGCLWGRGSCDTKASLALFAWLTALAARRGSAEYNLVFAAVCDEEMGFAGSRAAAAALRADLAIAGEPTSLRVLARHKGVIRFVLSAHGQSCHSSTPGKGKNAIYLLARAISRLEDKALEWQAVRDPEMGARTLAVTTVSGGQAANVIPASAQAEVDVRLLPGDAFDAIRAELLACVGPEVDLGAPYIDGPPLSADTNNALLVRLVECSGQDASWAAYATDAAHYSAGGIPSVVFGPGDAALAHTALERVSLEEIEGAAGILQRFLGILDG